MRALILLVAGLIPCPFLPVLPDWRVFALLSLALVLVPRLRPFAWCPAGLAWSCLACTRLAGAMLSAGLEGRVLPVEGCVSGLPQTGRFGSVFLFEVRQGDAAPRVPPRLRLSGKGDWPAGSCWRVSVRLKRAEGPANPYGFDRLRTMVAAGVLAEGRVMGRPLRLMAQEGVARQFGSWRAQAHGRIRRVLGAGREAALVGALALGVQQDIARADWQVLARTGTTHLLAISGLHVGMVAALAGGLTRLVFRWGGGGRAPGQRALWCALLAACCYALLAGFSVPARRAVIMLGVWVACRQAGRPVRGFQVWWLALALVLLSAPLSVLTPGLWLSFGMVGALLLAGGFRRRPPTGWQAWGVMQAAVTLLSVLPLLMWFGAVPLLSVLFNAWAIPWVTWCLVPLSLLGLCLPFDPVLQLAGRAASVFFAMLSAGQDAPLWLPPALPPLLLLSALAGGLWLVAGLPGVRLAWLLWLPLPFWQAPMPPCGRFRLQVLDVGQGLSVLVTTCRHHLLYDTGALDASQVVLPQLVGLGVRKLDRLVLSHHDADHDAAAPGIMQAMPAGRVLVGQTASWPGAPSCRQGQHWQEDGVAFEVLSPGPGAAPEQGNNAMSCVVRVRSDRLTVLLTGDIPASVEARLVRDVPDGLVADILLSPHHGSKSSSSVPFLDQVQARTVIISNGYRNRYGHPHAEVLARYRQRGMAIWRTDEAGLVEVAPDGRIEGWRMRRPYWWRVQNSSEAVTLLPQP